MRVLVPPVVVDGKVCRVVAPVSTLIEVQEWTGEYWLPSNILLLTVSAAPPASISVLYRLGIPASGSAGDKVRHQLGVTEATLIAMAADVSAHTDALNDLDHTTIRSRRDQYPGSKRFRRNALSGADADAPPVRKR